MKRYQRLSRARDFRTVQTLVNYNNARGQTLFSNEERGRSGVITERIADSDSALNKLRDEIR